MSCKHCAHCAEESRRDMPTVWRSDSAKESSCNFCNRFIAPNGQIRRHDVTCIRSPSPNGLFVRICDECLQYLNRVRAGVT